MAKDLNKVMLTGRLGADVEMKFTPQGSAVANFRVASNRSYTSNDEKREETEWFTVIAWNKLAEICNQYLRKGSRVYIEGRLQTRSWDDPTSGEKRYKTEVIANDMIILDERASAGGESAPARGASPELDFDEPPRARGATPAKPSAGRSKAVQEEDLPF